MMKRKKHGGRNSESSTALRDALFHGSAGLSSSHTMHSSPYRTRPSPFGPGRTNQPTVSWDTALSPALDDAGAEDFGEAECLESFTRQAEAKRREMGWSTSFPAEYHHTHQTRDYQQTLAYQEQLNQRKQSEQQLTKAVVSGVPIPKVSFPNAPSPNRQELELLKHVTMREGILDKLKALTHSGGATGFQGADTGTELLQLLLHLRDASVAVISAMAKWHQSITTTKARATPPAFLYQGHNYCAKMVADLNFLAASSALGRVLGVEPTRMKQNPFMMPSPIPERDFHELQRHSASSPPQFRFDHAIDRVAEAEKYLVWSLVNLPEGISNASQSHDSLQQLPTPRTTQGKRELLTWQQRAEQQLRVLSMPLESPSTGQTHVMDSSCMMKRKGYLPSLPQSPSKTLTQLMETVHKGGYTSPTRTTGFASFEAFHDGISYRMTALDIEVLGSNDVAPPHAIVTLVAASVLILLSPSDRIPKELAWSSCQKMLSNGLKLIRRIERVDVDAIPAFKWKALLPFLHNEHYNPMFLMEYSSAAATLCAWVLEVLERAQHRDRVASKSDDDRREILEELEQLEDEYPVPVAAEPLRPISRNGGSRGNNKRVTIGNAEVLFINENEPVSPPSTATLVSLSNGGSRPVSSSSSVSAITRRHVLLRTSPWTHRGVTYFVSFFLETRDEHPDDQVLSIKLYEPMSSVESQMFVSVEDLRLDFGECAVEFFEGREFGLLCDLVLARLDGMMAPLSSRGGLASRGTWRRPSDAVEPNAQSPDDVDAAAVRIQSLARSASAKKELQQLKKEKEHEDEQVQASVRIQCAARQRHARKKVQHVRFAKQHHSATKIQSLARQRLAQKQVAHMRILQRTPTGLARAVDADDEDQGDDDPVATRLAGLQTMELTEQDEERPAQREDLDEPMDDMGGVRLETSMSYASEQFEDEFEADDA